MKIEAVRLSKTYGSGEAAVQAGLWRPVYRRRKWS